MSTGGGSKRKRASNTPVEHHADNASRTVDDAHARNEDEGGDVVAEDDLCPVCQLLLFRPVTTKCKHTLCESCMAHWADVSITSQMTIVSLDDIPTSMPANSVEARCPMCRTSTTASLNPSLAETLRSRYPSTYANRQVEESIPSDEDTTIETLTLYIGNTHRLKPPENPEDTTSNKHEWTFFVRPSRTDIIEEVQIFLHPTFRPPRVIRSLPPYEIRRLGWGYFTITAHVILKAGYSWVSEDAERAPDGAEKGMLPLNWTLDFDGDGRQGRCRLKVRSESWVDEEDGEEEVARERARMRRQYERDGNWMPPDGWEGLVS